MHEGSLLHESKEKIVFFSLLEKNIDQGLGVTVKRRNNQKKYLLKPKKKIQIKNRLRLSGNSHSIKKVNSNN